MPVETWKLEFLGTRVDHVAFDYVVPVGGLNVAHFYFLGFVSYEIDGSHGVSLVDCVKLKIVSCTQKHFCRQRPWGLSS